MRRLNIGWCLAAGFLRGLLGSRKQCHVVGIRQEQLELGELIFVLDGGRHGNEAQVGTCFVGPKNNTAFPDKHKSLFFVSYEEKSLMARRDVNRGLMNQVEIMSVFSRGPLVIKRTQRKHFEGTTLGNVIGPVAVPRYEDATVWKVEPKVKKEIYGTKGKVLVGGPCPGSAVPKPELQGGEPATWHGSPMTLYEEILHSFQVSVVIDATMVDDTFALACLKSKTPYIGITFTAEHAQHVRARLMTSLWQEMQREGSELYQVGLWGSPVVGRSSFIALGCPNSQPFACFLACKWGAGSQSASN